MSSRRFTRRCFDFVSILLMSCEPRKIGRAKGLEHRTQLKQKMIEKKNLYFFSNSKSFSESVNLSSMNLHCLLEKSSSFLTWQFKIVIETRNINFELATFSGFLSWMFYPMLQLNKHLDWKCSLIQGGYRNKQTKD